MNTWWLAIERSCTSYEELKHRKVVAQGWADLGDIRTLCSIVSDESNWDTFKSIIGLLAKNIYGEDSKEINRSPLVMWNLLRLKKGDIVIGIEGTSVKGFCQMENNGWESYRHTDPETYEYSQTVGFPVEWIDWDVNKFNFTPTAPRQSAQGIEALRKDSQRVIDILRLHNFIKQPIISDSWSDELIEKTRKEINDFDRLTFDEKVHFKNFDSRYGYITESNILAKKFIIVNKKNNEEMVYSNIDDLIKDGWVID